MAARPATLWAAVAPVVVGSALAAADGSWRPFPFVVVLAAAVAIQVGVNLANDVADAARGVDTLERIGPPRAVAAGLLTPRQMWKGVAVAFGVAIVCGAYLIAEAGPVIAALGVASILAAFGYASGPAPYGYRSLGEVFVFLFFGLVATVGTRFVFDRSAPASAWIAGVAMGLMATAILVANNFRDIETDAAAGKRTLAVRLGRPATASLYAVTIIGGILVAPAAALVGGLPRGGLAALAALPPAIPLVLTLRRSTGGAELIAVLKRTARLQIVVAFLLAAGVLAGG